MSKFKIVNQKSEHSDFRDEKICWINYKRSRDTFLNSCVEEQSDFNIFGSNFIFKHLHVLNKYSNLLEELDNKYFFDKFQLQIDLITDNIIDEKNLEDEYILTEEEREISYEIITNMYDGRDILRRKSIRSKPLTLEMQLAYNSFLFYISFYIRHYYIFTELPEENHDSFYSYLNKVKEDTKLETIFDILKSFKELLQECDNEKVLYRSYSNYLENLLFLKNNLNNFKYIGKKYIWEILLSDKNLINQIIMNTKDISCIFNYDCYMGDCISYDIIHKETKRTYSDLSDGEQEILSISIDLIHHLDINKNKNTFILLDEIDNSLHPMWKKEILNIQINLVKNFINIYSNTYIHLVFTTHSPFMISDLAKENILFLKNGKEDKGLHKQTFGANIHTLLSDSFFMKDGLMGEFAKGKINEIKEFYEKVIEEKRTDENIEFYGEHQEKFWQIQEIIGEPFLQKIVQNQLEEIELILLGRDQAIDNEIARLQALKKSSKNA